MNKVILLGRITKDIEIENYGETQVARFNIAINRKGKKDETDFIPCTAFNNMAINIQKYFGRGNLICIGGRIQINNYKDKDGNNRTSTTILVEEFGFCGESKKESTTTNDVALDLSNVEDSDLPF